MKRSLLTPTVEIDADAPVFCPANEARCRFFTKHVEPDPFSNMGDGFKIDHRARRGDVDDPDGVPFASMFQDGVVDVRLDPGLLALLEGSPNSPRDHLPH